MRKRISCKIIKSVPLGGVDDRPHGCSVNVQHLKISDIGTSIYTNRLVIIRTCIDEKPTAQMLDCCA